MNVFDDLNIILLTAILCLFIIGTLIWVKRLQDIKRLRQNIQIAKRQTEEMAQLLIYNPYPFIQLSKDGDILFANPAAYTQFSGLGREWADHAVLLGLLGMMDGNHKKEVTREISYDDKTWVQMIVPVMSSGFAVYFYDVTERKEFEIRIAESQRIADAANQAKGDFLANMSHELRTPMNGIIGLSGILMNMKMDAKARELSEAINSSSHNLLGLLNDILDFSKIEAGELNLERIAFDVRQMIYQIVRLQSSVAVAKGVSLEHIIDETIPRYLSGDVARLQQILNNLVGNALKFTDAGSVIIHVGGRFIEQNLYEIHISVRDTGIGIPENQQENIFKKFTQADVSTSRKYGGTGLGLTITRQLVEMMNGRISLESTSDVGTVFHVHIPLYVAEVQQVNQHDDAPESLTVRGAANILVVDDHPVNLLFMRNILGTFGIQNITEAKNGYEALKLLEEHDYDLILMDCQMPEMNGFEVTQSIRTKDGNRHIIIAVTADAMKGAKEKCLAAGMNDYLSKPVQAEQLKDILHKWLPRSPIFNQVQLNEFTDGNARHEGEMISLFASITQESLAALESSIREDDREEWKNHTHRLYGSSATFGAMTFAGICEEAQGLHSADPAQKQEILKKIISEYRQLDTYLQQRRSA